MAVFPTKYQVTNKKSQPYGLWYYPAAIHPFRTTV